MRSSTGALIILVAFVLVAAACADDDATAATTTAPAVADDGTAASSASFTTAPSGEAAQPDPDGDIGDLLARFEMTPLRTTYLFGMGDDQTEVIVAQDPTAIPPVESITIVEADSKIITTDGATIFCDGSTNLCFEIPGGGGDSIVTGLLGPFAGGVFLTAGSAGLIPGATEPITVAGRDGVCFAYEAPTNLGGDTSVVHQCIDNEFGFTLLLQSEQATTNEIETVMELIDFSQPTPEDFELTGPLAATP